MTALNIPRIRSLAKSYFWKRVAEELPEGPMKWDCIGMSAKNRHSVAWADEHEAFRARVERFCAEQRSAR